jgi:hypothetical protein
VNGEAQRLRWRCDDLRRLADAVERTQLLSLERHAGPETWRSAAAEQCVAELSDDQVRLFHAADDLRWMAWQLERQADELELLDALRPPIG